MICPKCGKELEDGKLLCEQCGEEIKIVPDFDIELEAQINATISSMVDDIVQPETEEQYVEDSEEEYEEDTEELKDNLRDYYSAHEFTRNGKRALIVVGSIAIVILAVILNVWLMRNSQNNSYEYQYDRAIECASNDHYDEAIAYLERALAISPDNAEARFLLAKYYDRNGQQQSAIQVLKELLNLTIDNKEEVYDLLLSIYQAREEYEQMGELLKKCDIDTIATKYNEYAATEPVFNKEGGVYDELISITMKGNTEGFVYYTLDGSTPTTNSLVYETPVLLESGDYTVKAFFVNMYGIQSDMVTKTYYINLSEPDEPVVNLDSGNYSEPQFIEIYHDDNTKIFYTLDGTTPTSKALRYTEPIEMPYGVSNFSIVAINEDGLSSPVLKRTYQLNIQANFSAELVIQVLINNLWAQGELVDVQGHVANKLGVNRYGVRTVVEIDGFVYYIIYEEYIDTMGKAHDTNHIYAVNSATADLYKAWKVGEGKYTLRPFSQEE